MFFFLKSLLYLEPRLHDYKDKRTRALRGKQQTSSLSVYQLDGLDTPIVENMDTTLIVSESVWQFKRSAIEQTKNAKVTHRRKSLQKDFQTRTALAAT